MSPTVTDAASRLSKNAELWQKFILHEDQLTNVSDIPVVNNMSSAKAQKATDTLTDEDQNETVRYFCLSENCVTDLL